MLCSDAYGGLRQRILIVPPPNANWNFALLRHPPYRQPNLAGYAHIRCPRQDYI